MLKDLWFPVLLAFFGLAGGGFLAASAEGTARRMWLTVMMVLLMLSFLSYIWGDPVRGPFYGALHPAASDKFTLVSGSNVHTFPIKQLSKGLDLNLGLPFRLKVTKTWWAGRRYDLAVRYEYRDYEIVKDNKVDRTQLPPNAPWDLNFDDSALELVKPIPLGVQRDQNPNLPPMYAPEDWRPIFQVVWDGDYNVRVNAVVPVQNNGIMITDVNGLRTKPIADLEPRDFQRNLFKYPSDANKGTRN